MFLLKTMLCIGLSLWLPSAWCAGLSVGQSVPELSATLLDGTTVFKTRPGHVTLVNFWATWCAPCKAEMPALEQYYKDHKAQGLDVLAISMDAPGQEAQVRQWEAQFSFSVALKNQSKVAPLGRVWRLPSTFVIDGQGRLQKNGSEGDPSVDAQLLESLVTPLLPATAASVKN